MRKVWHQSNGKIPFVTKMIYILNKLITWFQAPEVVIEISTCFIVHYTSYKSCPSVEGGVRYALRIV